MERQVRLQLGLRIRRTLVPTLKVALPTLKTILLGKRSAWTYRLQLTCNGNVSQRHCFRIDRLQFPIWSIARIKELRRSAALIRRNESHWRSGITSWKGQVGRERCSFVSPLIENNEFPIRIFFVFYLRSDLTIRLKNFRIIADVYRRWKYIRYRTFRSSTSSTDPSIVGERGFIHKEVKSGSQRLLIKAVVPWNSNISYCGIWCSFRIAEGSSTDHVLSDSLFLRFHVRTNAHPRQFPFCLPLQVCLCVSCLPPLTSIVNIFSIFFPFFLAFLFSCFGEKSLREEKCARFCFNEINEKGSAILSGNIGLACRSRFPISLDAVRTTRLLR